MVQTLLSWLKTYTPSSIHTFQSGYSLTALRQDLGAGVTVGIVALPLAMAFAIASGATPEMGLFTAIVAGLIISVFGGSRFQIGGPTGAFVVIVSGVTARHGFDGLLITTVMAGLMLILMGVFKLGRLLQYIPYPVTAGFTSGIGLLIFASQLKDFFGLHLAHTPTHFLDTLTTCAQAAPTATMTTVSLGILTLIAMLTVRRYIPRIPAPFVGILLATATTWAFGLQTATIGSRFGGIPSSLPGIIPLWQTDINLQALLPDAFTIAILAGIESLLSATVADGMSGDKHNSSTELIAQGLANIFSAVFGGLPATGAIARTATNIRAGAFSPIAGIIHVITLVLFILFLAPLASLIPLTSLAAVLIVVAWDMSEPHRIRRLFLAPKSDSLIMMLVMGLTIFIDLTVAVEMGVVLAAMLFMKRMSELTDIHSLNAELPEENFINKRSRQKQVVLYEISGPMFFGMAQRFIDVMNFTREKPKVLIICMRHVPTIDATGLEALETVVHRMQAQGIRLILSGVHPRIMKIMRRLKTTDLVGEKNIFRDYPAAMKNALLQFPESKTLAKDLDNSIPAT